MTKFKEKDLLEYFDDMCLFLANHHWTKRDERAVAIREMIQKPEGFPKKRALTVDEIISKYPESIRILLSELVQKLDALQEKPEIDEEFINKWAGIFHIPYSHGIDETKKDIKHMFKDAGVEVVGK